MTDLWTKRSREVESFYAFRGSFSKSPINPSPEMGIIAPKHLLNIYKARITLASNQYGTSI